MHMPAWFSFTPRLQAWLAFALITLLALVVNRHFFFVQGITPWWDFAANDPLIKQAKHFELLHGNYSRVGFFHPGPFYLYLLAAGEWLFHDVIPIFPSDIAAQFFSASLFASGALALTWWLGATSAGFKGGLLATIFTATIGFHYSAVLCNFYDFHTLANFIVSPWFPHLYMVTCIYLTVAVFALFLHGPQWWPLIIFSLLQLMHGHASFLLLAPIMGIMVLMGHAYYLGLSPRAYITAQRHQLYRSMPIIIIMLLPMALQLILHWPGEFAHYLNHANNSALHTPLESMELYMSSLPLPILCLLMLWLVNDRAWRIAGATGFIAASLAVWIYMTKGVDTLHFRYLIFWYDQLMATLFAFLLLAWVKRERVLMHVFLGAAALMIVASVRHYQPMMPQKYHEQQYLPVLEKLQQESEKHGTLALYLEKQTINVPIDELLHMLILLRAENKPIPFCFGPGSWNTMFLRETRCTPEQAQKNKILVSYPPLPFPLMTQTSLAHFYAMDGRESEMEPYILHVGEYNNFLTPQP